MTRIEWADMAHAVVRGCSPCSPGCKHCYAARNDGTRLKHLEFIGSDGTARKRGDLVQIVRREARYTRYVYTSEVHLDADALAKALKLPRVRNGERRTVFWNHTSDTFHEGLTNEEIAAQFGVMAARPDLTFLVLTKRAKRMRAWFEWHATRAMKRLMADYWPRGAFYPLETALSAVLGYDKTRDICTPQWPLPNVWLGVSVESPDYYDRIHDLVATPAAKRFLSLEPMLADMPALPLEGIDWVIVGAESGSGARHAPLAWLRSVRDQVLAARVKYKACRGNGERQSGSGMGAQIMGECGDCAGRGWRGPALFIKQWDVCEACTGSANGTGLSAALAVIGCYCDGTGQIGKVHKGNPAIDGKVWAEVPR